MKEIDRIAELEQENAELKAKVEVLDEMTGIFSARLCQKYKQTLQEIKTIAEDGTKTEDYLLGQRYTDLIDRILDLITKAEEQTDEK